MRLIGRQVSYSNETLSAVQRFTVYSKISTNVLLGVINHLRRRRNKSWRRGGVNLFSCSQSRNDDVSHARDNVFCCMVIYWQNDQFCLILDSYVFDSEKETLFSVKEGPRMNRYREQVVDYRA